MRTGGGLFSKPASQPGTECKKKTNVEYVRQPVKDSGGVPILDSYGKPLYFAALVLFNKNIIPNLITCATLWIENKEDSDKFKQLFDPIFRMFENLLDSQQIPNGASISLFVLDVDNKDSSIYRGLIPFSRTREMTFKNILLEVFIKRYVIRLLKTLPDHISAHVPVCIDEVNNYLTLEREEIKKLAIDAYNLKPATGGARIPGKGIAPKPKPRSNQVKSQKNIGTNRRRL